MLGTQLLQVYGNRTTIKGDSAKGKVELCVFENGEKEILRTVYIKKKIPFEKLQSLKIEGIPEILSIDKSNPEATLVREKYIEGQTLDAFVKQSGKLSEQTIRKFMLKACDILISLHKAGILHRDIKPQNIIIDTKEDLWLIDFDAAREYDKENTAVKDYIIRNTELNTTTELEEIMLTRVYAPPEQYASEMTVPESDIYSLGKTMEEMLEGEGILKSILQQCHKEDLQQRFPSVVVLKELLVAEDEVFINTYLNALNGNPKSQYDIGFVYFEKQDYDNAIAWFKKAFGNQYFDTDYRAESAYKIGESYYSLNNQVQGNEWFGRAVDLGNLKAVNKLPLLTVLQKVQGSWKWLLSKSGLIAIVGLLYLIVYSWYSWTFFLERGGISQSKILNYSNQQKTHAVYVEAMEAYAKNDYKKAVQSADNGIKYYPEMAEWYCIRAAANFRILEREQRLAAKLGKIDLIDDQGQKIRDGNKLKISQSIREDLRETTNDSKTGRKRAVVSKATLASAYLFAILEEGSIEAASRGLKEVGNNVVYRIDILYLMSQQYEKKGDISKSVECLDKILHIDKNQYCEERSILNQEFYTRIAKNKILTYRKKQPDADYDNIIEVCKKQKARLLNLKGLG